MTLNRRTSAALLSLSLLPGAVWASGAPAVAAPAPLHAPGTAPLDATPSLPSVSSGARPGPDLLYAPVPAAPQLENRDPRFRAAPLLVSGHEAYVAGEYLYQDYLYDDHGSLAQSVDVRNQAATNSVTAAGLSANALSYHVGSVTYPTDPVYASNSADLVEFRMAPGATSTAYRFTLNALLRADTTIVTVALDTDRDAATGTATLPRDPGAPFPGTDAVLTTWGTGAEVSTFTAAGALIATTPVTVVTDLEADQITVTVPRAVQDPAGTVRATVATGLHDAATGGWLRPGLDQPTATRPGGGGPEDPQPSGIFNLGLRFDESVQVMNTPPDEKQAEALRAHAPTTFAHEIDVAALRAGVTRTTVPATGLQIRMFPSRVAQGEGRQAAFPQTLGQLQPYVLHIPPSGATSRPHPLLLSIHSNGQHYWQFNGTGVMTELGDAHDTVVVSPLGRGRNGWYVDESEADVFEAWADAARHVRLDPDRTAISGYSMGGHAAYRIGGLYPDLFGKAFSVVGPPGKKQWLPPMPPDDGIQTLSNLWLPSTRNLPYLNMAMVMDELVPVTGTQAQNSGNPALGIAGFEQLGYRYRFLLFPQGEHYTLAALGYHFTEAVDFLADTSVDRDPAHVTLARVPSADNPSLGLVHDHAYWLSAVRMAGDQSVPGSVGTIDARSHGFGVGDPVSTAGESAGVMGLPFLEQNRTWGEAPAEPVANRVDVSMTDIASAVLDLPRARLSLDTPLTLEITADQASALVLTGGGDRTVTATRDGVAVPVSGGTEVGLTVAEGTHTYVLTASSAAVPTALNPRGVTPTGVLATTGLPAGAALLGLLLTGAGVLLRRRRA